MPISLVPCDRDPFPALLGDRLGLGRELFGDKTIEQGNVTKPTAIIAFEEITFDNPARLGVGIHSNEASTTIGGAHGIFRQRPSKLIRLIMAGAGSILPDLHLSGVIG